MIKAILFDMDGVLIDAKDWHYEALNSALGLFGHTITRDAHLSTFDGLPTRNKLEILSESRGLPRGLHEFLNDLKQTYTHILTVKNCKPTFNHQYALSELKKRGYKLAVCSNSIRKTVELMMNLANLSDYLDVIYSNEDVDVGKPNPEMYLRAMADLNVKPEEALILEDNEHGIKAAIDSGAYLFKIDQPSDVILENILLRINEIKMMS